VLWGGAKNSVRVLKRAKNKTRAI